MAKTIFSEKNKLAWFGVRPGVYGEQIVKYGSAFNATVVLYTVPADNTLLVFNTWYQSIMAASVGLVLTFGVYDAVPALDYAFYDTINPGFSCVSNGNNSRFVPYEVPEGYSIRLVCGSAVGIISGGFEGILINPSENA